MKSPIQFLIILLIAGMMVIAGCTKYAEPELKIMSNLTKISEDPVSGNITYDVQATVANVGSNNAYQVRLLAILSTPKDLPEYRFINKNIEVGDVEKGKTQIVTERMILPTTKSNYDLISSGSLQPVIEIRLISSSSNIMD